MGTVTNVDDCFPCFIHRNVTVSEFGCNFLASLDWSCDFEIDECGIMEQKGSWYINTVERRGTFLLQK